MNHCDPDPGESTGPAEHRNSFDDPGSNQVNCIVPRPITMVAQSGGEVTRLLDRRLVECLPAIDAALALAWPRFGEARLFAIRARRARWLP